MHRGTSFWFLSLLALWTSINGVVADWNYTHLLNPQWGPHAKFHDGVSIAAGIILGLIALFYIWRHGAKSTGDLQFGVVAMVAFWASLLSGFLFPGTGGTLSEHPEFVPRILGIPINEVTIAISALIAIFITAHFERLRRVKSAS
jgi:hypothetical protein